MMYFKKDSDNFTIFTSKIRGWKLIFAFGNPSSRTKFKIKQRICFKTAKDKTAKELGPEYRHFILEELFNSDL